MNVSEHEYGCLGCTAGAREMERFGKNGGWNDRESLGAAMTTRKREPWVVDKDGLLRGQFRKIGMQGRGYDEERMGRVGQKCVNVQILILQLTLSLKSVRCDSFEIVEMTSARAVPLCRDHDHAVRCSS